MERCQICELPAVDWKGRRHHVLGRECCRVAGRQQHNEVQEIKIAECVRMERSRFRQSHGLHGGSWYEPMRDAERTFRGSVFSEADYRVGVKCKSRALSKFKVAYDNALRRLIEIISGLNPGGTGGKLFSGENMVRFLARRNRARTERDYGFADVMRKDLELCGIRLSDVGGETRWSIWPHAETHEAV